MGVFGLGTLGALLWLLPASVASSNLVFDDEGIEVLSLWRRRRYLRYRDITKVRWSISGGYVLRASTGVSLFVSEALGGGLTLARYVLTHLPQTAVVSPRARKHLVAWAASDAQ